MKTKNELVRIRILGLLILIAMLAFTGCGEGGGGLADNGGMSGTGVSQGSIGSFGSIFVNGVEWNVSGAAIDIDGMTASENELRVGMVVRIEGDFEAGNLAGTALRVSVDDVIEGPIESAPIETIPGLEKTFTILGQTVVVGSESTVFDDGASFANLASGAVVEVAGFVDPLGSIQATRVSLRGMFPADDDVDLTGFVANLVTNPDGSGIFDLDTIVVRYTDMTIFTDVTRSAIANGDRVEVAGRLRISGSEVDADEIELDPIGLGGGDLVRVEIEGVVAMCPQSMDFCIDGTPVDTSSATFDPLGFVPMPGDFVEVEGALLAGTLVADRVESEEDDANRRNVRIEAAVTSVDTVSTSLVILGVDIDADADTTLEDRSAIDDESFMFDEIRPGDFVEVRGIDDGSGSIRALSIKREDATPGNDDIRIEGPVTALNAVTPSLSILGQPIPLDGATSYFDAFGAARSEEQFFRNPGDVMIGDIVRAEDASAASLSVLGEADSVSIEN